MKHTFAIMILLSMKIPIYIPIRFGYEGASAFLSNVRPQYMVQTGEMEFAEVYVSVTLPL